MSTKERTGLLRLFERLVVVNEQRFCSRHMLKLQGWGCETCFCWVGWQPIYEEAQVSCSIEPPGGADRHERGPSPLKVSNVLSTADREEGRR